MRKQIVRIGPMQLGKVSAVFYAILSLPIAVIMAIAAMLSPAEGGMPLLFFLAVALVYLVFGFIFMALAAWIYNLIVKWTGGIEFDTEETSGA